MHSLHTYAVGPKDRYSAKRMAKPIYFICVAPDASQVSLIGDFNGWQPDANPMRRQPDGAWMTQVSLSHGHHHYLFLVDGKRTLDPRAHGIARDENNERVSLVAIS
jgi:1,4-alpha-glucan branching enzyme